MDKNMIRKIMKEKRLSIKEETLLSYNQSIYEQVINHSIYQQSKIIGIYVSFQNEVDTIKIISDSFSTHRVCVPRIEEGTMSFYEINSLNDLKEGHFHVLEPIGNHLIRPTEIDLMIVPMLAYDAKLYRVGYGKGYYDRYFEQNFSGYKLGLAFSFQKVNSININQFDCALDEIIHE